MKKVYYLIVFIFFSCFHFVNASNYYWVHTTSNWTDISNWRTTSGGGTNHATPPQNGDDVFFDANSFPSLTPIVNINSPGSCRNITFSGGWVNNPTITQNASLDIYGSLTLHTSINGTNAFPGTINFEGTSIGLTIATAGKEIGTLNFNGIGGSWGLSDSLKANGIFITNGSFNTNNYNITTINFQSGGSNTRAITLGTSTIDMTGNSPTWNVLSVGLTLGSNLSTINFNGITNETFTCGTSQVYNNINFTNTASLTDYFTSGNNSTFNQVSFASYCLVSGSALQFNKITCLQDARLGLKSYTTIQTLVLTSGKRYTFQSNQTLNVTNLTANGNCNGYVEMRSSAPPVQATINNTSNNTIDHVILEAINMLPVPANSATNSIDAGNNSGWAFTAPASATCYWVGGTGNWNDASNHWANVSGGTPGSACVPMYLDNVVFDANSFSASGQTVSINTQAYCNNMTWLLNPTHAPNFTSGINFPLSIYGSLTLDATISTFNIQGAVYFKATSGPKTITSAGKAFSGTVYFDGIGGIWNLQDAFTANAYFSDTYLNNGTLTTNNHQMNLFLFKSITGNRSLNLGSSLVVLENGWNVTGSNFNLNAGTSTLRFPNLGGYFYHTAAPGKDYYNIEFNDPDQSSGGSMNNGASNASFNTVIFKGGGSLLGSGRFNNLTFSAGKNYALSSSTTFTVSSSFTANGTCSGFIDISSVSPGTQSILYMPAGNTTINYCILKDQRATGPGVYTANNSIDQGNNTSWVIPASVSRNLFWVGGSGNWSDQNHWSTTPNGAGGACIPTSSDDVYFTQYSFPSAGQAVTVDVLANCRNMKWNGHAPTASGPALNNPTFLSTGSDISIYGSLTLIPAMNWNFNAYTHFKATTTGQTITSANQDFDLDIFFEGIGGEWILQDALVATSSSIYHNNGIFRTNNYNVTARDFDSFGVSVRQLYMGSSVFFISSTMSILGTNLILSAGTSGIKTSNLYFSSPTLTSNRLYDITLSLPVSTLSTVGGTVYFHHVKFVGGGNIAGNNNYNKLTFSPGKTYTLGSNQTQTVDTLDARGNNCYKIIIRSSTIGTRATISQASGNVICDFLDLKDQNAFGGATFYAGQFSINTGNNAGWNFNNAPGYIFGLGPDTTFQSCGASITLTTANFNGSATTTYTWYNGSTGSSLNVTTPGVYWVSVNYGAACIIVDSIHITFNPTLINLQVSPNASICQGSSISLTASGGVSYSWGPATSLSSTTGPSVTATPTSTTNYTVTAVNGLCTDNKIFTITVTPSPILNVTPSASVCQGISATLTVSGAVLYIWSPSTGLSSSTGSNILINPTSTTTYTVTGSSGGCIAVAISTISVKNKTSAIINQTACSTYTLNGQTYNTTGIYSQTLINSVGCDSILTLNLNINNLITTSASLTICAGQSAIVHGVSQNTSGIYSQTFVAASGCDSISTITLAVNNSITTSSSVTICLGQSVMIHGVNQNTSGVYSQTFVAVSGCDSISRVTLAMNNRINTSSSLPICSGQSIIIHGTSQNTLGIYSQTFVAVAGCDSVSTITLTLNAPTTNTLTIATCSNYTLNGQIYAQTGIYTQTLISSSGCDSILTLNLTINNTIATSASLIICSGQSVMIHGISQNTSGIYSQTFVAAAGCDSISDITLAVNSSITTSATLVICAGQSAMIHSTSQNISGIYSQTFIAAGGCDSASIVTLLVNAPITNTLIVATCNAYIFNGQNYNATGLYSQRLVSSSGCDSLLTLDLTIGKTITTSATLTLCSGQLAMIHGINQNTAGLYSQTFTAADGCDSISTIKLTINALPDVRFTADIKQGCAELCVNFTNTTANVSSAEWDYGDANSQNTTFPLHCYANAGSYSVGLIVIDINGCEDSLTIANMITVYPHPTSQFIISSTVATTGNPIIVTDMSTGANVWSWSFGDASQTTSTAQNAYYTYADSGNYLVKQVVTNQFGCVDSSERYVRINPDYTFYVPNAITPNGDGLNDEFIPRTTGLDMSRDYELTVYDRWGNLIFKTNNPMQGWNARINSIGNIAAQDVYVWKIFTWDTSGKSHVYEGHITLIR